MRPHSTIPSARFSVDRLIGMVEPLCSARVAVRWSLLGAHSGWGMVGAPTGAEVDIIWITHTEFGRHGLR